MTEISQEKKHFEDIKDGALLDCRKVYITKQDILAFGKKFDPLPFHTSEDEAEKSLFKGLVASSLHTLSACTRIVVDALSDVRIVSGVGLEEVKMPNPVRPGDTLNVSAWWSDLRRSESKPEFGFGTVKCRVSNQKGEPVLSYGYKYIIATRDMRFF